MPVRPPFAIAAGGLVVAVLALTGAAIKGGPMAEGLTAEALEAIHESGGQGIEANFRTAGGSPTRHPLLSGGEKLSDPIRKKAAQAVAAVPGVGGVRWADGTMRAEAGEIPLTPLHCQDDVEALLRARTIRFDEGSAGIDPASSTLIDEVASALLPCLGSIIAVTGHTDNAGPEPGNIALSLKRAHAVREALVSRGIPRDGLHTSGVGSSQPVEGLDPADPANRRIEFSVLATVPIKPTPVDTPGAR